MAATDEELQLIAEYQRTRSSRAGDAILHMHRKWLMREAYSAARKFGIGLDEALQAARLGMMEAVERFEPERGLMLITYASHRVRRMIAAARAEAAGAPSAYYLGRKAQISRAVRQLRADRVPVTDETIAAKLGVGVTTVQVAMVPHRTTSMDAPLTGPDGDDGGTMHDYLAAPAQLRPDHLIEDKHDTEALRNVLEDAIESALTPRNAQIMKMWLDADCEMGAQTAIAAQLGVTNQRVSLAVMQSLPKLRAALKNDRRIADIISGLNRELEAERRRDDAWFKSLREARFAKS